MKIDEDIILIAGPTASGKTRLAIEIALANDCVIINTDSMQVYNDLAIITARPDACELSQAPHLLFGHVDAGVHFSVARWLEDAAPLLAQFAQDKRKMVFVGGTGLYFNALILGLSPIPEVDQAVRDKWRNATDRTAEELHQELANLDHVAALELRPSDRQRILRALEVIESTGKSIHHWQAQKGEALIPDGMAVKKLLLMPERGLLHDRINQRFDTMMEYNALEEVAQLLARNLPPDLPAMKAIGVPQLAAFLRDELPMHDAIEKAKAASRQYAKRQITWFRNSFDERWEMV